MRSRRKRLCGAAAWALLLSVCSNLAMAEEPCGSLRATLDARYAAMKTAMEAHDAAALKSTLASGFSSVTMGGQSLNADQMIADVNRIPPDPHRSSVTTVLSCTGSVKDLIVKQKYDMKVERPGQDGAPHHIELISLSTDTWVKPGATWLLQKTSTNDMTFYKDGKLVAHRRARPQ